jgi:hypothetical protein
MRFRRDKPDPSEQAYARLNPPAAPYEPLPPRLHQFDRKRLLVYAVLLVVVVAVLRDGLGRGAPEVDGSCDSPGFAFSTSDVTQDAPVKWAVKGPAGTQVVITADSTDAARNRVLGPVPLAGCAAEGRFGARLPDGEHLMRVFLLRPDGTSSLVGLTTLTVNAPR